MCICKTCRLRGGTVQNGKKIVAENCDNNCGISFFFKCEKK